MQIFKTRPEFADISNTRVLDSKPSVPARNSQNNSNNFPPNNQFSSTSHSLSTSLSGALPSSKEPLPQQIAQVMRMGNNTPRTPSDGRSVSTHVASLSVSTPATNYLRSPQMNNLDVSHHQHRTGNKSISVPNAQLNPGWCAVTKLAILGLFLSDCHFRSRSPQQCEQQFGIFEFPLFELVRLHHAI